MRGNIFVGVAGGIGLTIILLGATSSFLSRGDKEQTKTLDLCGKVTAEPYETNVKGRDNYEVSLDVNFNLLGGKEPIYSCVGVCENHLVDLPADAYSRNELFPLNRQVELTNLSDFPDIRRGDDIVVKVPVKTNNSNSVLSEGYSKRGSISYSTLRGNLVAYGRPRENNCGPMID